MCLRRTNVLKTFISTSRATITYYHIYPSCNCCNRRELTLQIVAHSMHKSYSRNKFKNFKLPGIYTVPNSSQRFHVKRRSKLLKGWMQQRLLWDFAEPNNNDNNKNNILNAGKSSLLVMFVDLKVIESRELKDSFVLKMAKLSFNRMMRMYFGNQNLYLVYIQKQWSYLQVKWR